MPPMLPRPRVTIIKNPPSAAGRCKWCHAFGVVKFAAVIPSLDPIGLLRLVLLAILLSTGCTPAGPRALLHGKRLIEQRKYNEAIEQLKVATSLLSTNAHAWNYLG